MNRILSLIISMLLVMIYGTAMTQVSDQMESASILYYSGGSGNLQLQPVPATVSFYLPIAGTTPMKTLMVRIKGKGDEQRPIPVDGSGSFNQCILLKGGPGSYTVYIYGSPVEKSLKFNGICTFTITSTEPVPAKLSFIALNEKVLEFAESMMGKKVGRGECWDLAQEALDLYGADWTRPMKFGKSINPDTEEVLPGDIIQFRSVKTVTRDGNITRFEFLGNPDHTAIISKVLGKVRYELLHQNTSGKRYVIKSIVDLTNMTAGKFWIYRPFAGSFTCDQLKQH